MGDGSWELGVGSWEMGVVAEFASRGGCTHNRSRPPKTARKLRHQPNPTPQLLGECNAHATK
jgi:hypothetical protein